MELGLLFSVFLGIGILLLLILKFKIPAFISLLISSIVVGIFAGMEPLAIIEAVKEGMGSTLGFVAVVVGLGAMFGAVLEHSGGAEALANYLLTKFGEKNASWALVIAGFFIAIPVFFDVAFIILVPLVYSLQRKTKKSLLLFAIPLLAGLAITHSFIPPTPGPVAVADILKADLGWVILFGFIVGIPSAIVSGPLFAKYISKRIYVAAPPVANVDKKENIAYPPVILIFSIVAIPILLIVSNTVLNSSLVGGNLVSASVKGWLGMIGHPFVALIIANLVAWYLLGVKRGLNKSILFKITSKSLEPAGVIILLTGAGGVFKQVLINTGIGAMLANYFANNGVNILVFSFVAAALIRVLQGSSTVAMITAAGITAPLLPSTISSIDSALLVISIASGASILSHVNDSGFWLVGKMLNIDEKQTFRSWSVMTTLLSFVGFTTVLFLSWIF